MDRDGDRAARYGVAEHLVAVAAGHDRRAVRARRRSAPTLFAPNAVAASSIAAVSSGPATTGAVTSASCIV